MKKILSATSVASSFFLSFFLSVLFISCEKDESLVDPAQEEVAPDYEAVSSARDWFFAQTGGDVLLEVQSQAKSTGNSTTQYALLGDWESSLTTQIDDIKNVEVPVYSVDNEEAYSEALNGTGGLKSGKTDTNDENLPSRTRYVIQTDEKTGTTRGFMMTVIPDDAYLATGGTIDSMDYYNRGIDFSGLIVFNHLDGSFANAWEYEEGNIIKAFLKNEITKNNNLKRTSEIMIVKFCTRIEVSYGGYTTSKDGHCWTCAYSVSSYSTDNSSSHQTNILRGGGGAASGGSGEYIEPQKPQVTSKTPLVDDIISKSTLNSDQKLLLEKALDELIGVCSDGYIYNELVAQGKKYNFAMDSDLDGLAGYEPSSKTFYFRNNDAFSSGKLKEEFFHAFQDAFYFGGTSQYGTTGKVNIEFEAKLYRDITAPNCCQAFYETTAPQDIKDDYEQWIRSVKTSHGNVVSSTDYQQWLKLFNQYSLAYNSSLSSALSYPHALDHIINMSNCF